MSLEEVAELIRNTKDWGKGYPVRLYTCNTGTPSSDGEALAKKLADLLGRDVEGPNGFVNVNEAHAGLPQFMKSPPYVSSELGDGSHADREFLNFPAGK